MRRFSGSADRRLRASVLTKPHEVGMGANV